MFALCFCYSIAFVRKAEMITTCRTEMSCSRRMLRCYCNERPKGRRALVYSSFFSSFLLSPTNELPVSFYDVQYAPFLLSTSMVLLVAAVIIPPCTLNTVIPEFLRRVVYGNSRCRYKYSYKYKNCNPHPDTTISGDGRCSRYRKSPADVERERY